MFLLAVICFTFLLHVQSVEGYKKNVNKPSDNPRYNGVVKSLQMRKERLILSSFYKDDGDKKRSGSTCWSAAIYHGLSKQLAAGIGHISSDAVCVFSDKNTTSLKNEDCPPTCKLLLSSVWGDCYCRDPTFVPKFNSILEPITAIPELKNKNVRELYEFIVYSSPLAKTANCRSWLREMENMNKWECKEERK